MLRVHSIFDDSEGNGKTVERVLENSDISINHDNFILMHMIASVFVAVRPRLLGTLINVMEASCLDENAVLIAQQRCCLMLSKNEL